MIRLSTNRTSWRYDGHRATEIFLRTPIAENWKTTAKWLLFAYIGGDSHFPVEAIQTMWVKYRVCCRKENGLQDPWSLGLARLIRIAERPQTSPFQPQALHMASSICVLTSSSDRTMCRMLNWQRPRVCRSSNIETLERIREYPRPQAHPNLADSCFSAASRCLRSCPCRPSRRSGRVRRCLGAFLGASIP